MLKVNEKQKSSGEAKMLQRLNEPLGVPGFSPTDRAMYSGAVSLTREATTYPEIETKLCISFLTPLAH